jgi:predicted nucleic acid-binding protein
MRVPTIYLETTIFNFPFSDDAPNYKADAIKLFSEIKAGKFLPFTSEYVTRELVVTKDADKLKKMEYLLSNYGITIIPANPEIERLADVYIAAGVIPKKHATDALHIASATVANLDYIISLNFKHIVKHKTIIETEIINAREGFKRVFIHTPAEVIDHDENN